MNFKSINEWEVLTPSGWSDFKGIQTLKKETFFKITFDDGTILKCSENHKLKSIDDVFIYASEIKRGMILRGVDNNNKTVKSKRKINKNIDLYDLIEVEKNHEFYANNIVSSNCAFIDSIEEIWLSSQYTLSTGGRAILLSTPDGVGNFFHKTWVDAENKRNKFNCIKLPWYLHPDRDQTWRDEQTKLSGVKGAAQECDCEFTTTGNTVIELLTIQHYRDNIAKEPIEMRGNDKAYWIWEYPDYAKQYIVSADVSRGDAEDYSAFHVIDVDTLTQVAEYQGKINPKDYGNVLVGVATEYNNAILIVENATYGHTTLQQIIDRKYPNTFYSSADLQFVDLERQFTNKINAEERKLTPGFTTTSKTRPIMISNMEVYFREKSIVVRSIRLLNELSTFIWDGNKACAMANHHDDLVMSFAMGLWVRNTALKMRNSGMDITKSLLDGIHRSLPPIYKSSNAVAQNSWNMNVGTVYNDKKENLTWLL